MAGAATAGLSNLAPDAPGRSYGPAGVIRSEWTKFKSVRSTTWALLATLVLVLAIGALATGTEASRWQHLSLVDRLTFDPTRLSLTGLLFGQLAIGVLGVLVVSAEYSTGLIRATLAAVPNRPLVLASKAIVFGLVSLVVSLVVVFVAFFMGQAILSSSPAPQATIGDPGVVRAIIGGALYLTVLGLLALGLATMIRHTAGAISAFVGVLLILPLIVAALPTSISNDIGRFLPADIGHAIISVSPPAHQFSAWVGFGILCGYTAVALVVGGWLMSRRDA